MYKHGKPGFCLHKLNIVKHFKFWSNIHNDINVMNKYILMEQCVFMHKCILVTGICFVSVSDDDKFVHIKIKTLNSSVKRESQLVLYTRVLMRLNKLFNLFDPGVTSPDKTQYQIRDVIPQLEFQLTLLILCI